MYYLEEGLWFENADLSRGQVFHIGTYTDDLDLYYQSLSLDREAVRPATDIPDGLRQILRGLERHPGGAAVGAALLMLDGSGEARRQISEGVLRSDRETLLDGRVHSLRLNFGNKVLYLGSHSKPGNTEVAKSLASRWLGQEAIDEAWVVLWVPLLGFGSARAWHFRHAVGAADGSTMT